MEIKFMTQTLPNQCPLCSGALEITETSCLGCGVQMHGHFSLAPFKALDSEQMRFLETFLRCRGVIRDMEAALGISYPTVRARLDTLLSTLGYADGPVATPPPAPRAPTAEDSARRRKEILAAIQAGTLDADSGLRALHDLPL
jgi:hypothetical protein